MDDVEKIAKGLSDRMRYHVERGCISGDFTMNTINALASKGLMFMKIDSPNGHCGFMELTPLGEQVRSYLKGSRDD